MADRETITVALRVPARFPWRRNGSEGHGYNFVSVDHRRKFICFDEELVAAFTKSLLAGVEHAYIIERTPKRTERLVAIPGVYGLPHVKRLKTSAAQYAQRKPKHATRLLNQHVSVIQTADGAIAESSRAAAEGIAAGLTAAGRCLRCGRKLTDPISAARGIGPDCLTEFGGELAWRTFTQAFLTQHDPREGGTDDGPARTAAV